MHALGKLAAPARLHLNVRQNDLRASVQRIDLRHNVGFTLPALRQVREDFLVRKRYAIEVQPRGDSGEEELHELAEESAKQLLEYLVVIHECPALGWSGAP